MRLTASLLALCLAVPLAARAENTRLAAAIRLYQRAELDAASAELKAAEEQSKDEGDLVQILIYRGLVAAETGQTASMSESFKRALAMRPWAELPTDVSPRLAKMFQDARREVWGSSGIKAWPKKAPGAPPTKPPANDPAAASTAPAATPSAPPGSHSAHGQPGAPAPAEEPKAQPTPSTAPPAEPAPSAEPKPAPPPPSDPAADAPPDVPPTAK